MNWKSRMGIAAALLVLGVFAVAGAAGAGSKVKSKVKITDIAASGAKGKVVAKKAKCERNRKVVLLRVDVPDDPYGESGTANTKVGADKTNRRGKWRIKTSLGSGAYTAKVKPKAAGRQRCKGSRTGASL